MMVYMKIKSHLLHSTIRLNSLGNTSFGNITSGTGSVNINDDDPAPTFGISGASVNEDAKSGTATLTITRENSSQMDVSVDYLALMIVQLRVSRL